MFESPNGKGLVIEKETWSVALSRDNYLENKARLTGKGLAGY